MWGFSRTPFTTPITAVFSGEVWSCAAPHLFTWQITAFFALWRSVFYLRAAAPTSETWSVEKCLLVSVMSTIVFQRGVLKPGCSYTAFWRMGGGNWMGLKWDKRAPSKPVNQADKTSKCVGAKMIVLFIPAFQLLARFVSQQCNVSHGVCLLSAATVLVDASLWENLKMSGSFCTALTFAS